MMGRNDEGWSLGREADEEEPEHWRFWRRRRIQCHLISVLWLMGLGEAMVVVRSSANEQGCRIDRRSYPRSLLSLLSLLVLLYHLGFVSSVSSFVNDRGRRSLFLSFSFLSSGCIDRMADAPSRQPLHEFAIIHSGYCVDPKLQGSVLCACTCRHLDPPLLACPARIQEPATLRTPPSSIRLLALAIDPRPSLKPGCSGLEKHGFGEIPKKPGDNGGLGLATFCIAIHEQAKCWNARRPLLCILTLGFTRDFQAR